MFGKPYHLLEHKPDVIFPSFIFSVKRFVLFLKNKIIIILLIFFVNDLKNTKMNENKEVQRVDLRK